MSYHYLLARSPQAQGMNAAELAYLLGFCDSSSCYKFMRRLAHS
ncbi:hypothetical protein [Thalassolituus hydrocarboniclasticus]|nr:hypothetical protein [Thalassolituus hydrocarboniclasticus]